MICSLTSSILSSIPFPSFILFVSLFYFHPSLITSSHLSDPFYLYFSSCPSFFLPLFLSTIYISLLLSLISLLPSLFCILYIVSRVSSLIVPVIFFSGQRTEKLFEAVDRAAKQFSRRIPTAIINEVVQGTVLYFPILPCPVLYCHSVSCHSLSCPVTPCPALSCLILSFRVLSCPVLSCHSLSSPAIT